MKLNQIFVSCFVVGVMVSSACMAQPPNRDKPKDRPSDRVANDRAPQQRVLDKQQVEKLKEFVSENHPEALRLLNWLQNNRPEHFRKAIRTIASSYRRLMALKKNQPQRYEAALNMWKLRSRINLVAAQVTLKPSDELRKELRSMIKEHHRLRMEQLRQEKSKLASRLNRIDEQLGKSESEIEAIIQKEMRAVLRRAAQVKNGPARKSNDKRSNDRRPRKPGDDSQ